MEMASKKSWRKSLLHLGGLHIEVAVLKTLGNLLGDIGWTGALVHADTHPSSSPPGHRQ